MEKEDQEGNRVMLLHIKNDCYKFVFALMKGDGTSEVPKIARFQVYVLRHLQWKLANDH